MTETDLAVRRLVYAHFGRTGRALTRAQLAAKLERPLPWVDQHLASLAHERALVLAANGEIAKALPFCAAETEFAVRAGGITYYGNCAWDVFALVALLGPSAQFELHCGDCGELIEPDAQTLVHIAVPVAMWWQDIFFT